MSGEMIGNTGLEIFCHVLDLSPIFLSIRFFVPIRTHSLSLFLNKSRFFIGSNRIDGELETNAQSIMK